MDIYLQCIDISHDGQKSKVLTRKCVCEYTRQVLASVCFPRTLSETSYLELLQMMKQHCLDV